MPMTWMGSGIWWLFPLGGLVMMGLGAWIVLPRVGTRGSQNSPPPHPSDPLEIARERYARGEISHQEFEQLAQHLIHTEEPLSPSNRG